MPIECYDAREKFPAIKEFMRDLAYDNLIYKGRVAEVHDVGVRMPDGKVVQRDFIHFSGAAVILPVLTDGSIALIRNYRFAVDERLYELPAGMLEAGEDPAAGAARELAEETGFTAGRVEKIGQFYSAPGSTDELMHCFLATDLRRGAQALEVYEEITVELFPPARVRDMIASGEIHDAKTIATILMYWMKQGLAPR